MQQPEFWMVDQLPFFALFDRLDDQSYLFAELIDAVAVKIGHTSVGAQHCLNCAEVIFSRMHFVIGECFWQLRLAGIDCQKVDFCSVPSSFLRTRLTR